MQSRGPVPKKKRKRQECSGCENRISDGLCLARLGVCWILKEANKPRETGCKKSWDRFEEYDSLSLRYVLGQIQVKLLHQPSPYVKFEDRSHEETERQQRCARSKAWNLAKNIYKLKEEDQVTFFSPAEEWVLPAASTIKPEEREFVVDSGASMQMVSKRDFNSAGLETKRTSKNPTTVMTAMARCKQEKKPRYTSKNWTYS